MNNLERHELALMDPYHSIVRVFDCEEDKILTGIKNISSIPNTLMHKLEKCGFALHTIDRKSQLAGRAVDTELINPITGRWMSGSSSGTAVNVFAGINELGIGNDGGGSVLAPAMCVNIYGFISKLIEPDREQNIKKNTDGMSAGNSLGFMARDRKILFKAIKGSTGIEAAEEYGKVYSDCVYPGIDSKVIELELFGHFDERTKRIQNLSGKGYLRVCNTAEATALAIPDKGLGCATLLICESKEDKVGKLLKAAENIPDYKDELIERYFLNIGSYRNEGYQL